MLKDWVIIIGTLLIVLVLADGIRRKRNERMGKIKVSRSLKKALKQPSAADEDEDFTEPPSYTSELPNGGARVVGKRDPRAPIPSIEKKANAKSYVEKQQRNSLTETPIYRAKREPEQASLNLGQSVPILMESVEDKNRNLSLEERIEPSFSAAPSTHAADLDDDYDDADDFVGSEHGKSDYVEESDRDYRDDDDYDDEYDAAEDDYREGDESYDEEAGYDADRDAYDRDDYEEDEEDQEYGNSSSSSKHTNELSQQSAPEPEEVLIINVMAPKGEMFNGSELLDVVLKCGMRYGSMDIFHRYSDAKGEGALLFSMANMVKPGTFDLDAMDEFTTPGVSLFMTLPINADSMQSFELMADTARAIADALQGELKDEQRSVMTRQTLEHCRERIRNFERTRLFRRPPR